MTYLNWILSVIFLLGLYSCTSDGGHDTKDTASNTEMTIPTDTHTASLDTNDSETDEDTGLDTADGFGAIGEECYSGIQNETLLVWCDTPELIAQQCDDYASGCCCRAPCQPTMCEGADETLPCTVFDAQPGLGYCDYSADNVPVLYECVDSCVPQSECMQVDTDGSCLDSDPEMNGVCLVAGADSDATVFCQPSCTVAKCDDSHYCSPIYIDGYFQGTGACLPFTN
ncbi:MAG: hypothetical protein JXR76_07430 [Deltaproteobacteria bacterium]|nr:hypothetical protein [Deltaproteobacteria bacterium]